MTIRQWLTDWWRDWREPLSHAEMLRRLKLVLATDPLPPPRILYEGTDGRERTP